MSLSTMLKLLGALAIVLTSFFITLKVLDETSIHVRSATYGANCGAPSGNVTDKVQGACDEKSYCDYGIDVTKLGDSAPNCAKDFTVAYTCGAKPALQAANVSREANGKLIHL